jgi:hypothetical protein
MKKILLTIGAGQLLCAGLAISAPNYVAHEWGTFTSVQGADGVQLAWNPLSVSELPGFVYNWTKAGKAEGAAQLVFIGKSESMSLQRMETPVIYFYSDDEITVSAKVDFPLGSMTEWYPKARFLGAGTLPVNGSGPRTLEWSGIQVSPVQQQAKSRPSLPEEKSGSHYYAARATDADILRVNGETEKFLFYRGVGNFRAPLTVTQSGEIGESIGLQNAGKEPLRQLFVYQRRGDQARYVFVPNLEASGRLQISLDSSVPFASSEEIRKKLGGELERALNREGLYEREAQAMVKTWDDSWFAEQGLRVFYALPGPWADRILPLSLEPKPAEVVRVMVGRAELITPQMENDLKREIVRYANGGLEEKASAVTAARALGLGRFLPTTVRRLTQQNQNKTFATQAAELLNAASKPEPAAKKLAAN